MKNKYEHLYDKYNQVNKKFKELMKVPYTREYPIRFDDVVILADIFGLTMQQVNRLDWLSVDELLFMSQFERRI